jgi:hypothetical protein
MTAIAALRRQIGRPNRGSTRPRLDPPFTFLPLSADSDGADMIAKSYLPDAPNHNGECFGLEPVRRHNLIGDSLPLFKLAKRSYARRLFSRGGAWSFDPIIQATRLDLRSEVSAALLRSIERSARCANGFTGCEHEGSTAVGIRQIPPPDASP